jgi:1-deoxy-D-xylulose-5-phosphate reductoisomerase
MPERRIILLGSTGSIGTQTLEVVEHLNALHARGQWPTSYRVVGLAAGRNVALLSEQYRRFEVENLAVAHDDVRDLSLGEGTPGFPRALLNARQGHDAAERLVREVECDIVLAAMVGSAGLPATLAAVDLGRDVALANKETLVAAGALVVPAAKKSGARLLPVDSEHAAIWQCLQGERGEGPNGRRCPPMDCPPDITRVILTASGGPFRTRSLEETYNATPAEALRHPTWNMGPKVTIDSASLTNKALEVIEAHWLFGLRGEQIDVLVHPQSIVHSLVEFADGSVIAQLGPPDMRSPIQYALTFPHRPTGASRKLDLAAMSQLEFMPPDRRRFPALDLAYKVIQCGGTSGAVLNAANEAAVEAFLAGKVPFGRIPELAAGALVELGVSPLRTLADVASADRAAREYVASSVALASTR